MNSTNVPELNRIDGRLYKQGYGYGAWVVRTDKLGLFPVCELLFFRKEPTEDSLRMNFGSHFLRFFPFSPHERVESNHGCIGSSIATPTQFMVENFGRK